jgi:hypothetical protein
MKEHFSKYLIADLARSRTNIAMDVANKGGFELRLQPLYDRVEESNVYRVTLQCDSAKKMSK